MSVLQRLLADGTAFDPHILPSMNSDHMPMTLCAMSALGASDQQLLAYQSDYSRKLRPWPHSPALRDWHAGVGEMSRYGALLPCFQEAMETRGEHVVVAEVLRELIPGLVVSAFHPLIRLAYGLDFGSTPEVAAGLAYMTAAAISVPIDSRPVDLRQALESQAREPMVIEGAGFAGGLLQLLAMDRYPVGAADSLAECATLALDVYRGTRNFFALHMVTATAAARICLPFVDERLLVAALTGALLAAHRIVGSPGFDAATPLPVPSRIDQEHAYKYVYACLAEYRVYGDERYLEEIAGFRSKGLVGDRIVVGGADPY